MRYWRLIDEQGFPCFVSTEDGKLPPRWHKGTPRPVEVPRMPEDFEDWDPVAGAWVKDHGGQADHLAGPAFIAAVHATKSIEAMLIGAGVMVDGFIRAEAEALGLPIEELAAQIRDKNREPIAQEVARRVSKAKGRGASPAA